MSNGKTAYLSPEHKRTEATQAPDRNLNWNFSAQENAALNLPNISSHLESGPDSRKYMDAPHASTG